MTDPNTTDLLAALDFTVQCEVGHPDGYGHGVNAPCTNPAAWTAHYHACAPAPEKPEEVGGTGSGPWCTHHLAQIAIHIQTLIASHANRCVCGYQYSRTGDLIWDVKRLTERAE